MSEEDFFGWISITETVILTQGTIPQSEQLENSTWRWFCSAHILKMSLYVIAFNLLLVEMQGPWGDRKEKWKPQTGGAVPGEGTPSWHGSIITEAGSENHHFTPSSKTSCLHWILHFIQCCRNTLFFLTTYQRLWARVSGFWLMVPVRSIW